MCPTQRAKDSFSFTGQPHCVQDPKQAKDSFSGHPTLVAPKDSLQNGCSWKSSHPEWTSQRIPTSFLTRNKNKREGECSAFPLRRLYLKSTFFSFLRFLVQLA